MDDDYKFEQFQSVEMNTNRAEILVERMFEKIQELFSVLNGDLENQSSRSITELLLDSSIHKNTLIQICETEGFEAFKSELLRLFILSSTKTENITGGDDPSYLRKTISMLNSISETELQTKAEIDKIVEDSSGAINNI